ncbi:uncharacterized protein LOC107292762 [Protobothrops mucrosquamatus]|uniref:uncharacterized protein LOC107292762 n=1 Tax=Protobothrops mucrosquamatus TaxID=103944 RepID=UPI000775FA92|nr:uncharacterized protein LOC107292762 [Protobothrops mucrosquamatus]
MAASANKGNPKKVGFFDWLIEQINSGSYTGLEWTDKNHTEFCIPWKHYSKRDLVADDYKIFRAWAMYSKKYNKSTPSKWKLNFRCAMNSTKRFEELVSDKPDFHKYRIIPLKPKTESTANLSSGTNNGSDHEVQVLHFSPYSEECPPLHQSAQLCQYVQQNLSSGSQLEIDAAFQTLTLENGMPGSAVPNENAAGSFYQTRDDMLQWIIQESQLNLTEKLQVSQASTVTTDSSNPIGNAVLYEQRSSSEAPQVIQNDCLPTGNGVVVEPVAINYYQEGPQWLPANPTNQISQSTVAFPVSHAQQNVPGTNQFNQSVYCIRVIAKILLMVDLNVYVGSAVPNENAAGSFYQTRDDMLQWIIQESELNLTEKLQVSRAPTVTTDSSNPIGNAVLYEQRSSSEAPQVTQNDCLPTGNGVVVEPVAINYYQEGPQWLPANPTNQISQSTVAFPVSHAQQNVPGTNQFNQSEESVCNTSCFVTNIYLNEEPQDNGIANQETPMEESVFVSSATFPTDEPAINNVPSQDPLETVPITIEVSIYYHNKLQDKAEVDNCMFTYNQENCHLPHNAQVIKFPNPEVLTDQKRVQHTLIALNTASLLLSQKNGRIWAKRLGTCQVFHAFSKELDNPSQDPPHKLLPRNVETEIFNYEQFIQELHEFRNGQRRSSPDYTIYLCFGQRFTAARPKESKLILVKLVPNYCKYWHEFLQREGFSSLNSETVSLQISNSLFDMVEQLSTMLMQTDTAY